jgi:hypothetical protein
VLKARAALVEELYAEPPGARVVMLASSSVSDDCPRP